MSKKIINALPQGTVLHGKSCNYVVEKPLGQGSFGTTYQAKVQIQGALGSLDSNMYVAVKEFFMKEVNGREGCTVTASADNGIFVDYKKKFQSEAQHLSELKHPNIINVLESFEENNTIYYVMEYIDGGSLDDYIMSKGSLTEAEAVDNLLQIGKALQTMHRNKMLHLDLKPANIMLRKNGTLVLIDFGLSKQFDENGEPESSTTIGGGTPPYAPLEQATYQRGDGFPETMDIYALGATAFKMLTGKRPPKADIILNEGFPYDALKQCSVSESLTKAVAKAMAPIKKDRFQTVESLLACLSHEQEDENEEKDDTLVKSVSGATNKPSSVKQEKTDSIASHIKAFGMAKIIFIAMVAIACVVGVLAIKSANGTVNIDDQSEELDTLSGMDIDTIAYIDTIVYISDEDINSEVSSTSNGFENGHEWVDLGLSVKWATMNVGANSPSDYGGYYAWGETRTKSNYDWSNCFDCLDSSGDSWGTYKTGGQTRITPTSGHDTARENWGGTWRMPTDAENEELRIKCKWIWTTQGGHKGYKVTGPNGNSIFLPAAGYRDGTDTYGVGGNGYYWSSSLSSSSSYSARNLYFNSSDHDTGYCDDRSYGQSVRPVTE